MFAITIENIDKLNELVFKLLMLTFLQSFIVIDDYIECGEGFETVSNFARDFLYDEQKKTVLEINKLIHDDRFFEKIL